MKKILLMIVISISGITSLQANNNEPDGSKKGNEVKLNISKSTGCTIRYHYYPNLQAYYDLKEKLYYFQMNGEWFTGENLPDNYGGYSLFKNEKVQITDYDGDNPETMIKIHTKTFPYNAKGRIKRPVENMIGNDILSTELASN
ncbi:hypothetical protein [Flavobacterium sp.]|uniref:hypothetical protein n=1 Tax=Flavobacterium sp. TaxID=239 RepID=UPI0035AE9453